MKLSHFITIAGFMITLIQAQDNDGLAKSTPEDRAKRQTEWMKSELTLDSAIESKVYYINLRYAKDNQSIINSGEGKLSKIKRAKANSTAKDNELKSILSNEQYEKYHLKKEEINKNNREKIRERRTGQYKK